jgi:hypothetical protein
MPTFRPRRIEDWQQRTRPHRARFVSAHLLFAPGRFVRDVPCDPSLYFTGDESTLGLRAFTHGYDLFEPSRVIVWHEYTRAGRRKHWDDHRGGAEPAWHVRDGVSRARIRELFEEPSVGRFGLGSERTLEEYEAYAGISCRHRKVQDYTRHNLEPPNPPAEKDWVLQVQKRRVGITVDLSLLPGDAINDAVFWYVGVDDDEGREIHRRDVDKAELWERLDGQSITLTADFESQADPATWRVIPYTQTNGWLQAVTGDIDHNGVDLNARRPSRVPGIEWESTGDRHIACLPGDASCRRELNSSGALLVELADGRLSVREIATYLRQAHELVDDPVNEILEFYENACSAGLVTIGEPR